MATISVQSYHSENDYAITVLSRPTSTVCRHTISPICDHGGPLTATKRPETSTNPTDFPLSTSNVIRVPSYHSKNDYAITVLSRPTTTVSRHTISPICDHGDHGGPPHSPKTGRNATQTTTFFFVDALSGLILCYPVIRTIFNTIFFVFVLNNVKFTIKKDPHGVKWPSNNTTKVVPRVAVPTLQKEGL